MFTGIIQAVGEVARLSPSASGTRLVIDPRGWAHAPRAGDSIAVDGVCLTVANVDGDMLNFDVVPETLSRTTLGDRLEGQRVNLEHALRADALMDGHAVQGHVDAVGLLADVRADAADWRLLVEAPAELADCIVPKGSIAIDGVSLTITHVDDAGRFGVALVPTTLERTTLGERRSGERCNIETDVIARTVVHYLRRRGT